MTNPMVNYSEMASAYAKNNFNVRDEYKDLSVEELKLVCAKDSLPVAVCTLNLVGDLNVGTMIRSASLFGVEKFIVYGRRKFDKRSTVGAQNYIDLDVIDGLTPDGKEIDYDGFVNYMNEKNYIPVFCEQGGLELGKIDWIKDIIPLFVNKVTRRNCLYTLCFVFGNESHGIPTEVMNRFEDKIIVSIPQKGVLRSFNVAAAMNIILWDYILKCG